MKRAKDLDIASIQRRLGKKVQVRALKFEENDDRGFLKWIATVDYKGMFFELDAYFTTDMRPKARDVIDELEHELENILESADLPYTNKMEGGIMVKLMNSDPQRLWVGREGWDKRSFRKKLREYIKEYKKSNKDRFCYGFVYSHCIKNFVRDVVFRTPSEVEAS